MRVMLLKTSLTPYLRMKRTLPKEECMGLAYLAASLRRRGHAVQLLDMDIQEIDESQVIANLNENDFDLVGITMPFAISGKSAADFLTRWAPSRKKHLHLTVGGPWATIMAKEVLRAIPGVDSVVLYEGEETLPDLAERLEQQRDWRATPGIAYQDEGGFHTSAPRPRLANLDDLPFPARDFLPPLLAANPSASALALSSRGCHRRCTFCRVGSFFGPWRARSAGNVVDELELLCKDFGITRVQFNDDNFIGPPAQGRQRAMAIAEQIRQRGLSLKFLLSCSADVMDYDTLSRLVDAGLYGVFVGIESGCQTRLTAYRKGTVQQNVQALQMLDRLGLLSRSYIGFIMFDPDGTLEEIQENLTFLREHVPSLIPENLVNTLDLMYADFRLLESPDPRALPQPLHLLRKLFTLIAMQTLDSYSRLARGSRKHTETWRLGALDIASYATQSLSELVNQQKLTEETYQALADKVESRAKALADGMTLYARRM